MTHQLVIRNASIVDGTGDAPYAGDVAIDGDKITALGKVDGRGREEIDAGGNAVTPGFIDLHTHLDAQIGWDPMLTSSTWHGVTTVLLGNCGATFAPCKPADKELLAGMMETVEDIPKEAILSGLPWDWESYGGYLDSIAKLRPMINVAGLVGHCAIRFYVMGERAIEEPATADEIRQIAELAGQSVKEGAIGFSTNRNLGHVLPDGRCIPGTFAEHDELRAIAKAVGQYGGIMQTVMNFREPDKEIDLIGEEASYCRGSLFSAVAGVTNRLDEKVMAFRAAGSNVTGVFVPRGSGNVGGLATDNLLHGDAWDELQEMDFDGRLAALKDDSMRQKLVQDVKDSPNAEQIMAQSRNWYPMGLADRPSYTGSPDESLGAIAGAAGEHPVETWIRLTLESEGKMLFHLQRRKTTLDSVAEMSTMEWAMPGLGDAGAHVSQMIDSGWTSFVLSHWHRDVGLYAIEEAVRRIAAVPAEVLGLIDRGTLAVGKRADINIIDIDKVAECQPQMVYDFPGGAPRFIQRATGYQATLCNGQVILRYDEHTGTRSGQVLKNQAAN